MTDGHRPLAGRTVLITGAGGGIGRALSLELAARGANVVATVRRLATGEDTASRVAAEGGICRPFEADCADYERVAAAVAFAESEFGGLDVVIHNAVLGHGSDIATIDSFPDETLGRMIDVCLGGAFNCAHAAFALLKRSPHARFLAMTSDFGLHGAATDPAYAAIKSGTRGLVKALAREWGPHGITVNAISPAALSEGAEEFFGANPEVKRVYYRKFPLGQIGRPREDIAEAIAALCEPSFDYWTGGTLILDGGLYTAL